jgi:hypothetical protein
MRPDQAASCAAVENVSIFERPDELGDPPRSAEQAVVATKRLRRRSAARTIFACGPSAGQ